MAVLVNPGTGDKMDCIESTFCAFCYKIEWWDGDGQDDFIKRTEDVNRFFTLTQRQLEIPEQLKTDMVQNCNKMSGGQNVRMDPCEMCLAFVRSFNELYHEMKCLELKLGFKMVSLLDKMREGGKLGPRKVLLKKILGAERFRELVTSRKNWGRHCSQRIQKSFPKVKLKKGLVPLNKPYGNCEIPGAQFGSVHQFCKIWLNSLTIVALLLADTKADVSRACQDNFDEIELDDGGCNKETRLGTPAEESEHGMEFSDNISCVSVPIQNPKDALRGEFRGTAELSRHVDMSNKENTHASSVMTALALKNTKTPNTTEIYADSVNSAFQPPEKSQGPTSSNEQFPVKPNCLRNVSATTNSSKNSNANLSPADSNVDADDVCEVDGNLSPLSSSSSESEDEIIKAGDFIKSETIDKLIPASVPDAVPSINLTVPPTPPSSKVMPDVKRYALRKRSMTPKKRPASDSESEPSVNDGDDEYQNHNSPGSDIGVNTNNDDEIIYNHDKRGKNEPMQASALKPLPSMKPPVPVSGQFLLCYLDGCKFKARKEEVFSAHQQLHQLGQYLCKFCCKFQASPWLLSSHEASEHFQKASENEKNLSKYNCARCSFSSNYRIAYANHFASEHLEVKGLPHVNPQVCTICKLEVKLPKRHFRSVHNTEGVEPDKILTCPEENCDAVFISGPGLDRHRREYHKVIELPTESDKYCWRRNYCRICDEHFPSNKAMEIHVTYHDVWTCQFCPEKFAFATKLAEHELDSHTINPPVEGVPRRNNCSRCNWGRTITTRSKFFMTAYLKHFLSTHLNLKTSRYPCLRCDVGFYALKTLEDHSLTCTGTSFKCDKCPRVFLRNIKLVIHKRAVHKDFSRDASAKPGVFKCDADECENTFEYEVDLEVHKLTMCKRTLVMRGRERICDICGRTLPSEGHLAMHMKSHDYKDKKGVTCEICGKNFVDMCRLKIHQEFHKDPEEWAFPCEKCSKKCVNKHKLEEHMRTHSKEKPFACHVCGERYAHKHNLRNHIRSKHKGVEVPVRKCARPQQWTSRKGKKLGKRRSVIQEEEEVEDTPESDSGSG